MQIPFSEKPGRFERHYCRRIDNKLFENSVSLNGEDLLEMQRLDHEELISFIAELRGIVQQAVTLKPNEESDVILKIKENLDRMYEASAGLADEQSGNQQAVGQLLEVIMKTVWAAADGDPKAMDELAQEEQARATHFELLKQPLVADLLHPETLIESTQLAATLLSESEEAVAAVLHMFSPEQQLEIASEAEALLKQKDNQRSLESAWLRLAQISDDQ